MAQEELHAEESEVEWVREAGLRGLRLQLYRACRMPLQVWKEQMTACRWRHRMAVVVQVQQHSVCR